MCPLLDHIGGGAEHCGCLLHAQPLFPEQPPCDDALICTAFKLGLVGFQWNHVGSRVRRAASDQSPAIGLRTALRDHRPSGFQPRVDVADDGDARRITAESPG
jgi:hypothetical protein